VMKALRNLSKAAERFQFDGAWPCQAPGFRGRATPSQRVPSPEGATAHLFVTNSAASEIMPSNPLMGNPPSEGQICAKDGSVTLSEMIPSHPAHRPRVFWRRGGSRRESKTEIPTPLMVFPSPMDFRSNDDPEDMCHVRPDRPNQPL
jgi:hypothetical protein